MMPRVRPQRSVSSGDHGLPAALSVVTTSDKRANLGPAPSAVKRPLSQRSGLGSLACMLGSLPTPKPWPSIRCTSRRIKVDDDTPYSPPGVCPSSVGPTPPYQLGPHEPDNLDPYAGERSGVPLLVIQEVAVSSRRQEPRARTPGPGRRSGHSRRASPRSLSPATTRDAEVQPAGPSAAPVSDAAPYSQRSGDAQTRPPSRLWPHTSSGWQSRNPWRRPPERHRDRGRPQLMTGPRTVQRKAQYR